MRPLHYLKRRLSPARRYLMRGDAARSRGDWPTAVRCYSRVVALRPASGPLHVQLGHALKQSDQRQHAAAAYRRALDLMPDDVDTRIHLADLLRVDGVLDQAAILYGQILALDPGRDDAWQALAEMGERRHAPGSAFAPQITAARAVRLAALEAQLAAERRTLSAITTYPVCLYDAFRQANPVPPPPGPPSVRPAIMILAFGASPAMLDATLRSIGTQALACPHVMIAGALAIRDHPVAGAVYRDHRITWVHRDDVARVIGQPLIVVAAGVVLDAHASGWLGYAAERTGGDIVYADHDRCIQDWRRGDLFEDPVLYGSHDARLIATGPFPPITTLIPTLTAVMVDALLAERNGLVTIRQLVLDGVRAIHVPRRLSSRLGLTRAARSAPSASFMMDELEMPPRIERHDPTVARPSAIGVVIPTRNEGVMLRSMIDSLRATASDPDRLRIAVFDNRSDDPATIAILTALRMEGVEVIGFDEPFNWSRINNRGAAMLNTDQLVFANNDMTMLSANWDVTLAAALADSVVGAVGARLLYPDGGYQHAGVLFGTDRDSLTVHEGVGHGGQDAGPGGRWRLPHSVAAVTGAFLGVRRPVFDMLAGFDEALAVAYNDLDFCLRIRERGQHILYCPDISLIHYESRSRGKNIARHQVAWDEGEQAFLGRRWGEALRHDPGYNPQWARNGIPFDGLREPDSDEVVRWIDAAAGGNPWEVGRSTKPAN